MLSRRKAAKHLVKGSRQDSSVAPLRKGFGMPDVSQINLRVTRGTALSLTFNRGKPQRAIRRSSSLNIRLLGRKYGLKTLPAQVEASQEKPGGAQGNHQSQPEGSISIPWRRGFGGRGGGA